MSLGESSLTVRKIIFDNGTMETTGRNRVNIEKIIDISPDIYDIFIIKGIVFSYSEWDKVKEYADKAREKGKTVTFKKCFALINDALCCDFYKKESDGYKYIKEKDDNNNDGVAVLKGKFTAGGWDRVQAAVSISEIIKKKKRN